MQVLSPEQSFRKAIENAAAKLGLHPASIPLTYPPRADLGDLASPVCFDLARTARKPPRALAEAIVEICEPGHGVARVEAAGPGYINAFLDRQTYLERFLGGAPSC